MSYYDDGEYDASKPSAKTEAPRSATEAGGYDKDGNQTLHIDINGYTTSSTYDDDQLVTQQVIHLGTTVDH